MILSTHSKWPGRKLRFWDALLVIALCLVTVHSVTLLAAGGRLEQELAALKAQGEPLSCSELAPPVVADGENGAIVYAAVFKRLAGAAFQNDDLLITDLLDPAKRQQNPAIWETARRVLARYGDIPGLVEEAEARPHCRFQVKWEDGYSALLPHLQYFRKMARILSAEALIAAREGRSGEAFHLLTEATRLQEALQDEPCLISQLVRISVVTTACNTLKEVAGPENIENPQAHELAKTLAQVKLEQSIVRAMKCERAAGIGLFQIVRSQPNAARALLSGGSEGKEEISGSGLVGIYLWRPLLYVDEIAYLKCIGRQIDRIATPWREIGDLEDSLHDMPRYAIVTRIVAPASSNVIRNRDMAEARLSGARIFLALTACKAQTGSYPTSLDGLSSVLGGKVPGDPFSGKGFVYRRQGKGFLLYSIGPNLKDEGGSEGSAGQSPNPNKPDDVVWRVEG